jgi:hypothetical protein
MSLSSILTYQNYVRDSATLETRFDKTSNIQSDIDYFKTALDKVKTVDELFKNPRLVSFIATATNLSGEEEYPGKMMRILSESVDKSDAVMYRISDNKRYAQAASTLMLGDGGLENIKLATTQDDLVSAYKTAKFEGSISDDNPAVRKARYFENYIGKTTSPYEILGDPILRDVVTTTLGLPAQIAVQPVETQAQTIADHVDITKFTDPKFRESFIKRYLTTYDMNNTDSSTNTDWRLSLLGGTTQSSGNYLVNLFA